jgi:N-acetylglucosaminyldiphosphoundecaprenol N-acetyl-beta-D-mannosaminyltransferase
MAPTIMTTLMPTAVTTELPQFSVLGVRIHNVAQHAAITGLEEVISLHVDRPTTAFFVNAHTLNLAATDPSYRAILNAGDLVFADGTGVRWAARLQGVRVAENLTGTDLVPAWFQSTLDRGHSCFLLGGDPLTIELAADFARRTFPGWRLAGYHDGYLTDDVMDGVVLDMINSAKPDVLLVGMGNPLQEKWIHRNLSELRVPLCMGVGGLFDYWAGNVSRSPSWLRWLGHEWLWRLTQEPGRLARRYLVGNPAFLGRVLCERWRS